MDKDYMTGNTRELASEWQANFAVSKTEGRISFEDIDRFFELVTEAAEACELMLGGGMQPILDKDYENM